MEQKSYPAHLLRGVDWRNISVKDLENIEKNKKNQNGSLEGRASSISLFSGTTEEFSAAKRPVMNKTESRYATEYLETEKLKGKILDYRFEAMRLVMAAKTSYTPDFMVVLPDKTIRFDEVKGFWEDDARVKIKMAAELFPWFSFRAIQWKMKEKIWRIEHFS